jgi:hypothetical protein
MGYLGSNPDGTSFTSFSERFSGDYSTLTFTLARLVASESDIDVYVNNVHQDPFVAYQLSVSGETSVLGFSEAPATGSNNILVAYKNYFITTIVPSDGSVTEAKLVDSAVTSGVYGSATAIPIITVSDKGIVSNVQNVTVNIPDPLNPFLLSGM